ncbi:hypothetical protein ACFLYU_03165 [Candidatus Dependentiae bacterium]
MIKKTLFLISLQLFCCYTALSMNDTSSDYKTQDHYDYTIAPYKALPETFIITDKKTGEEFNLNGTHGNIQSLIIKSDYVICSEQNNLYIWDLKKKYKACGIKLLASILNYTFGLNPTTKISCDFFISNIYFSKNHKKLMVKEKDTNKVKKKLSIKKEMLKRLKINKKTETINFAIF